MSFRFLCVAAALLPLTVTEQASAREQRGGVTDVAVIANARGESRILFRTDGLTLPEENLAIERALVKFSLQGEAADRRSQIRICPVTTDWSPASVDWDTGWDRPGGDFNEEVYTRVALEYSRGAHDVTADVTTLLKEIHEEGMEAYGFIVSVQPFEGEGIHLEDVDRFEGLASADLDVSYRLSGPHPGGRQDRGGERQSQARAVSSDR
jgi:hypothetical protein